MNTREATQKYRLNQWIEIIKECRSSGQTVSRWCNDHSISTDSYYYWLRKVRAAACESLPNISTENSSFVPVNIPVHTVETDSMDCKISPSILLRFGSITLELHNNASVTLIENTLRALQNVR